MPSPELRRALDEASEARARVVASAEILKVIAKSPSDVQPVFEAIANCAMRLLGAWSAVVVRFDGELLHFGAARGALPDTEQQVRQRFPARVREYSRFGGLAILNRTATQVADCLIDSDPRVREVAHLRGFRASLSVPILQDGEPLGSITVTRAKPGLFPDADISLLEAFADQAVIAIENVRLFNETKEALERQTATAEILNVISRSPTDVRPVFECIVRNAIRLTGGGTGGLFTSDGSMVDVGWIDASTDSEVAKLYRRSYPMPIGRNVPGNAAMRECRVVNVPDFEASNFEEGTKARARAGKYRSLVCVPMLRAGSAIGVIAVARRETGLFADHHVTLLQAFADQAVIAIENVRLFNETKESLERQTATAEILKVIARSPSDVQPVFEAIVQSARKLVGGFSAMVTRLVDETLHIAALTSTSIAGDEAARRRYPAPFAKLHGPGTAIRTRAPYYISDIETDPAIPVEVKEFARARDYRSVAFVPMLRGNSVIGVISVTRREQGAFTGHQIELLETFADQAVIAIENVRLFNETKEALERQTATAEILKVISSSPTDVQPVFDAILESATVLCDGHFGILGLYEGEHYKYVAHRGSNEKFAKWVVENGQYKPRPGGGIARMTAEREPIHIADVREATAYREGNPVTVALADIGGVRTYLSVPMLKDDRVIGGITIYRPEVRPFSDKQIELVSTFASQAVIAIENVRLFNEIKEKSRQLEEASQHKSNFLASMSHELRTPLNAILGFNEMILDEIYGPVAPDVRSPLEEMQASGKHLLRLINNVLDLAKIEAGRMELSLQDYSVHDTVGSVHSTLRSIAAEKGLEFLATVPDDVPLAHGDGGRIAQCLMNLAGNSLKFTKAGKVEISVETRGELLIYKVTDTGIGIPPDKIDSLFTEFKQTDATIASEYGGTGLGLSISKKFIEMHGGRIWIESELGKGSAFIFEVPFRAKAT